MSTGREVRGDVLAEYTPRHILAGRALHLEKESPMAPAIQQPLPPKKYRPTA